MDPGVAEADPGNRGGQQHLAAGLIVVRMLRGSDERLVDQFQRPQGPDIADRVGTLIGRALQRPGRFGTLVKGDSRVRFQRVAQDVQPAGGRHRRGQGPRVVRIDNPQCRFQVAMRDAGLGVPGHQIEDRHAGGFAAGAGRGRDGDQRFERAGDRLALANRRVDIVEEVGRIRGVQIGRLGRIERAAATHCQEGVKPAGRRKLGSILKTGVGRFDRDAIEQFVIHAGVGQRGLHGAAGRQIKQRRIDDQHHFADLHVSQVQSHFGGRPRTEADVGRGHLKRGVVSHR